MNDFQTLRNRHKLEEMAFIKSALSRNGWNVRVTAREIGVPNTSLHVLIETHEQLRAEYDKRKRRGRPRKEARK
jgi:hypothetical protein